MDIGERDWLRTAAALLRRSGRLDPDAPDDAVWAALARRTIEGIDVPPLGAPGAPPPDPALARPVAPQRGWDVRSLIVDPDARRAGAAAAAELAGGATSLWITVGRPGVPIDDLAAALGQVVLREAPVVISAGRRVTELDAATALAEWVDRRGPAAAGTSLGADPVGRAVRAQDERARDAEPPRDPGGTVGTGGTDDLDGTVAAVADLAMPRGLRGFVVDGLVAHEAGAGDAAELGYVLASAAWQLRRLTGLGAPIGQALGLLECRLAVTDEQFAAIAKVRAARVVWRRLGELCGASATEREPRLHAVTSWPMLTRRNPWVNLMRGTIAAFGAGAGGADAVTVLPFDSALGVPDELGRRLARNVSALLLGESHLAATADPAGGAWALEALTARIADAAWREFQRLEAAGGVLAALASGQLREPWHRSAAQRRASIADGRTPVTGVTTFPNPDEELPRRRPGHGPQRDAARWAEPHEAPLDGVAPGRVPGVRG